MFRVAQRATRTVTISTKGIQFRFRFRFSLPLLIQFSDTIFTNFVLLLTNQQLKRPLKEFTNFCKDVSTFPLTVLPPTNGDGCVRAQELNISPGEFREDALVIRTAVDLHYHNNACQAWTIYAE